MAVSDEVIQEFENQMKNGQSITILSELKQCQNEAEQLLQQWSIYEYNTKAQNKIDKGIINELVYSKKRDNKIKEFQKEILHEIMKKKLEIKKNEITRDKLLKDSYILLNRIGELFTGEPIEYSITIISSVTGERVTFTMGIEEFLTYAVSFQNTRISMHQDSLEERLEKANLKDSNITKFDWTNEKNNSMYNNYYLNLYYYGVAIITQGGSSIIGLDLENGNEGNNLEAYLHFAINKDNFSIIEQAKLVHLGKDNFNTLRENLQSARDQAYSKQKGGATPFWGGGDIGNIQVKFFGADVASIETLKNQLLRFVTMSRIIDFSKLENKIKSTAPQALNKVGNEVFQDILRNFGTIFQGKNLSLESFNSLQLDFDNL